MPNRTVLVVDDEDLALDVMRKSLTYMGYTTIAVNNGNEAIDYFIHEKIDAIITDVSMPVMNGIDLLIEIRKIDKKVPIILITGFDTEGTRKAAQFHHATAIIYKPFKIQQLKQLIDNTLSKVNSSV